MNAVLESIFAFLFKYRMVVFEKGDLTVGSPWPVAIVAVGVAAATMLVLAYLRLPATLRRRDRVVLTVLRLGVVGVLLIVLLRPMLVVATVVPQENFLAILVDDSRSMRIADLDGRKRGDVSQELLSPGERGLVDRLAERFKLRFFAFAGSTERVDGIEQLQFTGSATHLAQALERVRRELDPVPLAGVVLLSDGADNSETAVTETLLRLKAEGLPVYAVGLGRERFPKDIALGRVETPRTVLEGSSLVVELHIANTGFGGVRVPVQVESEGRIVSSQEIELPRSGQIATIPIQFPASEPGPRVFRFHVPPQLGELVAENNTREALIVVRRERQKILYFEGEPRFELKFVRRAVADDPNLQVVALLRTAENKFWRGDVDDAEELAAGFPKTREELFAYRGLIIGSVEASFFTPDQLRMISEFVSQRGGGLLMLGGRKAFTEGGYAGTAIADVLPVLLDGSMGEGESPVVEVRIQPTPVGSSHPATQVASSIDESTARWTELPALTTVNVVRSVKPGATTLLTGAAEGGDQFIVLASQRYGRGKALAFPVQDSWLWQMDMPLDDTTHETFWQQLLRWLVSGVPDPVDVVAARDRAAVGSAVPVTAVVADSAYLEVNGAEVTATITTPAGTEVTNRMEWNVETDGTYQMSLGVKERGLYKMRVEARRGPTLLGENHGYVHAAEPVDEFFDAELHPDLLQRLATETGGRYYTPSTVSGLPEDVQYTESGTTVREEMDLWDMPIIFLMLVVLVGTEWGYRRFQGLV